MINECFHLLPTTASERKVLKPISFSSSDRPGGSSNQLSIVVVDSVLHTCFGGPSFPVLQPCVSLVILDDLTPPWTCACKTLVQVLLSEGSRLRQESLDFTSLSSNNTFVVNIGLAHLSRQTSGTIFYLTWFTYSVIVLLHASRKRYNNSHHFLKFLILHFQHTNNPRLIKAKYNHMVGL